MSGEREESKHSKGDESRVDLEKKIIVLEAEKDKIKALFEQQLKILQERAEEAEKKEKEALSSKHKMLKVLENWKGDEKVVNDKISALQSQYEAMLHEMKLQHEEEVQAFKEQIEDLKSDLEGRKATLEKQVSEGQSCTERSTNRVRELEGRVSQLENENSRLVSEHRLLSVRTSQTLREASRDRYEREIDKVKADNRELTRVIQKEFGSNITSIVSEYEKRLLEMQTKLLLVTQNCSDCKVKVVSAIGAQSWNTMKDLFPSQFDFRSSSQHSSNADATSVQMKTLRNEVHELRTSLMMCEKKLTDNVHSSRLGPLIDDRGGARNSPQEYENKFYTENSESEQYKGHSKQRMGSAQNYKVLESLTDSVEYYNPRASSQHMLIRDDQDESKMLHYQCQEGYGAKSGLGAAHDSRSHLMGSATKTPVRTKN